MHLFHSRLLELEKIINRLKDRIDFLSKRSNRFSYYRFFVFITGATVSIASYFVSKELGWVMTFISLLFFGIVVHLHNKLLFGIRRCHEYLKIKEQHLARINIDWENIPDPAVNTSSQDMTTGKDLDLFGKYSLHNLIDLGVSYEGSELLRKWISIFTPSFKDIQKKQGIIKELSGLPVFRDKFLLKAKLVSKKYLNCENILAWTKKSGSIDIPSWLLPVMSVLIGAYIFSFVLSTFDITAGRYWLLFFIAYFFIRLSYNSKFRLIINDALELEKNLKKLTALINYIGKYSFSHYPNLKIFLNEFSGTERNALIKLNQLQRIISFLLIRGNPVIGIIVNLVFPYDIYFCKKLIKLKTEVVENIPEWLSKLNELECYISLANFSYLNPDYTYPEFETENKNTFEVKSIGHPLIARNKKICNDFSINNENEIIIITGSNMSGKSTFLRSIGINLCIAYSGAPVNAEFFKTTLFELFSCIKVNDSVVEGISYFYAEVKRLKELLDEFENGNGLPKFFLIDEIFKGTNNKERLTGSRAYIKKLFELKGTGMITTHDLELVNLADEINLIKNYHFKEEIVKDEMVFDYKIHIGPCPTTNALRIMEMSGLPVNPDL